ncbi:hypothetical protein AVBRAN9333_08165 [Campylobacter sp. RM9333]|uniref:hypothetical protein n=1 Tax=Campylobacter sp. RM9333 TaxID=2735731 RepID=UPI001D5E6CBB|nr:hypothetical protein [Campylobacter sp. RM9333]
MKKLIIIMLLALVNLFSQEPLSNEVLNEINILSNDLEQKTGIKTSVLISNEIPFKDLKQSIKTDKNYAIIVISLKDKKLDVISDLGLDFRSVTEYYYLKYGFFPKQGAILPILTQPKGKDLVNAAILNGFAELCDVIASSKGVELEYSYGDLNDNIINTIRTIFYIFTIIFIVVLIRRKVKKK